MLVHLAHCALGLLSVLKLDVAEALAHMVTVERHLRTQDHAELLERLEQIRVCPDCLTESLHKDVRLLLLI